MEENDSGVNTDRPWLPSGVTGEAAEAGPIGILPEADSACFIFSRPIREDSLFFTLFMLSSVQLVASGI
jgi:hypothetical protein